MADMKRRRSTDTVQSLADDRSGATELRQDRPDEMTASNDAVARRAYELYERRGREDGHDLEDWLQAEADVRPLAQGD